MRRMWWTRPRALLVLALLVLAFVRGRSFARRKEIDYDALEKAWEADDAKRELQSEADEQFERLNAASEGDAKTIGPQMVFVTLDTTESSGDIATRWKEMLWNGGVDVNIYEVEPGKVLLGLQKGIFMPELRAFLKDQPEVVEYEWNSKTYQREDTHDGRSPVKKTKKKKKGSKNKSKTRKQNSKTTTGQGQANKNAMNDEL